MSAAELEQVALPGPCMAPPQRRLPGHSTDGTTPGKRRRVEKWGQGLPGRVRHPGRASRRRVLTERASVCWHEPLQLFVEVLHDDELGRRPAGAVRGPVRLVGSAVVGGVASGRLGVAGSGASSAGDVYHGRGSGSAPDVQGRRSEACRGLVARLREERGRRTPSARTPIWRVVVVALAASIVLGLVGVWAGWQPASVFGRRSFPPASPDRRRDRRSLSPASQSSQGMSATST